MPDALSGREVIAVDIGGTHARFAIARIAGGRVVALEATTTLRTADHASLASAWGSFARASEAARGRPLPRAAAFAVACPVGDAVLKLTNNPWVIRPGELRDTLDIDDFTLVNDFGAIGHAVAQLDQAHFAHICGPNVPLPANDGVISIVGPGTGLGVAQLLLTGAGHRVIETEGGHIDYAPVDAIEDSLLARLRDRHRRASVERVVAGPGLAAIHEVLAAIDGRAVAPADDKALWSSAINGEDDLAVAALERFCMALGSVAGDMALAHGATAVVIAGGVGLRLAGILPRSGFAWRFAAKGRFEGRMQAIPVKLLIHAQPGLFGAAAAFAQSAGA